MWAADLVNATDYYPFGMPMPGRNGIASQSTWVPGRGFVAGNSYPDYLQVNARPYAPTPSFYRAGKEVELLPGFETAASDELTVEIVAGSGVLSNEYAGGEGSYESYGYYRYGFNGKENDNEVKGSGNQQDYGARIYDPRLGRWLSTDPLQAKFPAFSPYSYTLNNPIFYSDIDGREVGVSIVGNTITFTSTTYVDGVDAAAKVELFNAAFKQFTLPWFVPTQAMVCAFTIAVNLTNLLKDLT